MYSLYGINDKDYKDHATAWRAAVNDETREKIAEEVRLALLGSKDFNTTFEIKTKSGETRHIGARAHVARDERGQPIMMYGINWDRTDEENKSRSINFLLQQSSSVNKYAVISETDKAGKITFANENFYKITGYSHTEIMGETHRILSSQFHPKEFWAEMWRTVLSGEIWHQRVRNQRKNGSIYWLDDIVFPVFNQHGEIEKFQSIAFDISTEMRAEEALEVERVKAAHLGRLAYLGEVAGGIAHEINNPLAVIAGKLSQIERRIKGPQFAKELPKVLEDTSKCIRQVGRISHIIAGLQQFARNDNTQNVETVNTEDLTKDLLELCADKIATRGIQLKFIGTHHPLRCIRVQIEQVLINLINNSADAIELLSDKWIELSAKARGGFIEFSVTDSGNGIPKEIEEKLMQPFFTTKAIGKGTGLGLSISKNIIEAHHGTLKYDRDSKHTRFTILLPIQQDALLDINSIDEAIQAHLDWRRKITNYLTKPDGSLDPKKISQENNCALGKWLARQCLQHNAPELFHTLDRIHLD